MDSMSASGRDRNSASQLSLGAPFSPDLSLVPARVTPSLCWPDRSSSVSVVSEGKI